MTTRILVVDDSSTIRKLVEYTLKSKGFAVTAAPDGQAAWELFRPGLFQAAILDINMPRLNGLGLLQQIRADKAYDSLRVLMLTTEGREEDQEMAMKYGADGYLVKPFKPSELLAALEKVLAG